MAEVRDVHIKVTLDTSQFRRELRRAARSVRRLLPWRLRAQLFAKRCIDAVAIKLLGSEHTVAADRLWRLFGMTGQRGLADCTGCGGTGSRPDSRAAGHECPGCNGAGRVRSPGRGRRPGAGP